MYFVMFILKYIFLLESRIFIKIKFRDMNDIKHILVITPMLYYYFYLFEMNNGRKMNNILNLP